MLRMLESAEEKQAAQNKFELTLKAHLQCVGKKKIGYPGGNSDEIMYANGHGSLWACFLVSDDSSTRRYWNAFGFFDDGLRSHNIVLEINVPIGENSARVAGFYARDDESGVTYLMHDGGIGGGTKGVGQAAFMSWSTRPLTKTQTGDGVVRLGIVIGKIDDSDIASRIRKFAVEVRAFKNAVREGAVNQEFIVRARGDWEGYKRESSGRRKGSRGERLDYFSYHGDIVEALRQERAAIATSSEQVSNTFFVDLQVKDKGILKEIYEVKTTLERQSLYTAIGQLMTHSSENLSGIDRILVIPSGCLPAGLEHCLSELQIIVRRFELTHAPDRQVVLL